MFRRPMRIARVILLAVSTAAVLLAGCKSPCRQLSEKLCECAANTVEREQCLRNVARFETDAQPSDADQKTCEALLDKCDCHLIDTPEGKRNCGLAR